MVAPVTAAMLVVGLHISVLATGETATAYSTSVHTRPPCELHALRHDSERRRVLVLEVSDLRAGGRR